MWFSDDINCISVWINLSDIKVLDKGCLLPHEKVPSLCASTGGFVFPCQILTHDDLSWAQRNFPLNVKTASQRQTLLIHYSAQWRSNTQMKPRNNNNSELSAEVVLRCVNGDVNTSAGWCDDSGLVWTRSCRCWSEDELQNITDANQKLFFWPTFAG